MKIQHIILCIILNLLSSLATAQEYQIPQKIHSRYFGKKVLDNHFNSLVADDANVTINGESVAIDLWFEENDQVTTEHIRGVDTFLDNAESYMVTILFAIQQNYAQGGEVRAYIEEHLEELTQSPSRSWA